MNSQIIEIKGGASEFEAAVVAVVLDQITREEAAARRGVGSRKPGLPAWVRVVQPEDPGMSREQVWPD